MGESQISVNRGGKRWFMIAGPIAIFITIGLFQIDRYLTENNGEIIKGEVLRRLRTAQAGLETTHYDNRQGAYAETSAGLYVEMADVTSKAPEKSVEDHDSAEEHAHEESDSHSH